MKKNRITILLALLLVIGKINGQTMPNGYTPNFRFRMWAQGANPSADSLNANWKDIDHQIYKRGWTLGASKIYPTAAGWKTYFREIAGDTTGTDLVNIYGNASIGSISTNGALKQSYNAITAPSPGVVANIVTGINLINNTAATPLAWNNSPAIQLKQFSWNPTAGASQENSWYLHNWGFSTPGDAGGVFVITNKRPSGPNTYSSFAIDELGRTLIGYNKSHGANYYGFWGENFGSWGIILANNLPVVVGWPENSITTDLRVTGKITVDGNSSTFGTITAGSWQSSTPVAVLYGGTGATTAANARTNLGLSNVENTALSAWPGSGNITTLGTITAPLVISSAATSTLDIKGGSGLYNVGMVTYTANVARWLVGNHNSDNFSIYSYNLAQDILSINATTGITTIGELQGTTISGSTAWNTSGNITSTGKFDITKSTTGVPTVKITNDANSSAEKAIQIYSQGAERAYWASNGDIYIKIPRFNGTNTSGTGSAALGSNSPAVTNTAPYTWIQVTTADGSTGYIPVWK